MIQFQYSSSGDSTKAIYASTQYSGSYVKVQLTSSFTGNVTTFDSDVTSNKSTSYGGWLLLAIPNNSLPTASGQYSVNIYGAVGGGLGASWIQAQTTWNTTVQTWLDYDPEVLTGILTEDRAMVSGSDYDTITKYQFEDESNFTVYNG